jgi:YVTN family beta-propeller protein
VDGDVYAPDMGSDNGSVISESNDSVIATIPLADPPLGLVVDNSTGNLDVPLGSSDLSNLSVISAASNKVTGTIHVGGGGDSPMVYDSDNGELYAVDTAAGTLVAISPATNSVLSSVSVGNKPGALAYAYGSGTLYVGDEGTPTIDVVSDRTNSVVGTITFDQVPRPIVIGAVYDATNGEVMVSLTGTNSVGAVVILGIGGNSSVLTLVDCVLLGAAGIVVVVRATWLFSRRRARKRLPET